MQTISAFAWGGSLIPATDPQCQTIPLPANSELADFKELRSRYSMQQYEGIILGNINIVTLPIFNEYDERENNAVYRFINDIHPKTQDYVIRRQLLFKEGEPIRARLLNESERILRESSYLSDAVVIPHQMCAGKLDVLIITRELWTLLPKLYFSRKGGNNKYGLTLEDENILGLGNTLFVEFIHERERDTTAVGYRTKQLFGTRIVFDAIYSDTTDGIEKKLELFQPFYSLDTPWSLGIKLNERVFIETLEAFNQPIDTFKHYENEYHFSVGYSQGLINNFTQRYSLGFTRTEDIFEPTSTTPVSLPEDRILAYPWFNYSIVEDNFQIYRNLNALYRTEDVPIGAEFSATLGYADRKFDSELAQWVFNFSYNDSPLTLDRHLLKTELEIDGFWDRDVEDFVNTISSVQLSYYWLLAERHRPFVRLKYDQGTNLTQDSLLPLGGDEGLRGYPSEYLLGDERLLANIEYRYFFDAHYLNLFRFAGVIFLDVGQTKYNDSGIGENSELLSSAGIGLRLNSSKTNISRIVHLDLAFPLNERNQIDDYQVRITSDATF